MASRQPDKAPLIEKPPHTAHTSPHGTPPAPESPPDIASRVPPSSQTLVTRSFAHLPPPGSVISGNGPRKEIVQAHVLPADSDGTLPPSFDGSSVSRFSNPPPYKTGVEKPYTGAQLQKLFCSNFGEFVVTSPLFQPHGGDLYIFKDDDGKLYFRSSSEPRNGGLIGIVVLGKEGDNFPFRRARPKLTSYSDSPCPNPYCTHFLVPTGIFAWIYRAAKYFGQGLLFRPETYSAR